VIVPRSLTLRAPAKVNLLLDVGALRPGGYHDVTTIIAALEFGDVVTVSEAPVLSLERRPELPFDPTEDLCWRAAEALAREIGRSPAVAVRLDKRIPIAAGLGGGSSDAAAVLVGAARLWGLADDDPVIARVAGALGSDVPFFLRGGCGLYRGLGDVLVHGIPAPSLDVVLVNPGVPSPTGAVYAAFDRLDQPETLDPGPLETALERGDREAVAAALRNDLTEAAMQVAPEVAGVVEFVAGQPGILGALVAGSGSTVFGIAGDLASARAAAAGARTLGWWAEATTTTSQDIVPASPLA
jgi:4-diphosphocytidyl-2-C-methyl-D-erythritol kinase